MADATIYHNPNCSTSRHAMERANALGVEVDDVRYLTKPLDAEGLTHLVSILEDPITDLVRRDSSFKALQLSESDVETEAQVVALLAEHPKLMQRPVLVKGDRAIIGRPKDRVDAFLES